MMDMKTLANLRIDANVALATIGMVSDLFETEADPVTGRLTMGAERFDMYGQVLASIYGQVKQIADTLSKE